MIKRLIACLTICLIVTGLISPVFSDASALPQPNWNDPGISEVINISDLTNWMLNGGTYDVSRYTNSEDFMNDYFYGRTQTRLVSPADDSEDYYEVLPGFGINNQFVPGDSFSNPLDFNRVMSSSFRDHSGYGRRFSAEVNKSLLDSGNLYDMKIPLLNDVEFANFVGYNHNALKLYSNFFVSDGPVVNPDPNYLSYIDLINGSGFWFKDYPNMNNDNNSINGLINYPPASTSWVINNNTGNFNNYQDSYYVVTTDILSLYITSSSNVYSFTSTISDSMVLRNFVLPWSPYTGKPNGYIKRSNNMFGISNTSDTAINNNFSISGSLSDVLNYISVYFRNVNIYVDGVAWSLVGGNGPIITPEFPDAVGGEDLPSTTWSVYRPRAPYYTSVPGMLQAIDDAIADDGKLDLDDLKPYLTDENGDPVPDPIFDPQPVPIPVPDPVNPEVVPGLPELPVIPLDMPGYNGVSVLAEIINFTNQSLPTSLIVTFWGIVFGIVILGLIKILHK